MIWSFGEHVGGSMTWRFLMLVPVALLVCLVVALVARGAIAPRQGATKEILPDFPSGKTRAQKWLGKIDLKLSKETAETKKKKLSELN
jgi:hypothetical protein